MPYITLLYLSNSHTRFVFGEIYIKIEVWFRSRICPRSVDSGRICVPL